MNALGLGLAVVLATTTAAADTGGRQDARVLNHVVDAVARDARVTIFDDISASVNDGIVTLTGKVTMAEKRSAIEARVGRIDGVRQVRDDIAVLPVSRSDDLLRVRIARAIYENPRFWSYAAMADPPIHIIVEHGRVTLTGFVMSETDRLLACSLVNQFGVASVADDLKTGAEAGDNR